MNTQRCNSKYHIFLEDDDAPAPSSSSTLAVIGSDSSVYAVVVEQHRIVRRLLLDLVDRAYALRTWIQTQTPAMVEGMNMGVAVHAMAVRVTQEALVRIIL